MTNKEVLEKAIQKAVDGGWGSELLIPWSDGYGTLKLKSTTHLKEYDVEHVIYNHKFAKALWGEYAEKNTNRVHVACNNDGCWEDDITLDEFSVSYGEDSKERLIKEGYIDDADDNTSANLLTTVTNKGWQYHLQNMVIRENPLQYLKENI